MYAWYFGGSVKINLFNSFEDIEYLKKHSINICLDVCHLVLSANYFGKKWQDWFKDLYPLAQHYHLADAEGIDGEGLQIGKGDIKNFSNFLKPKKMKIIEVWQAHHNKGYGFVEAISLLSKQKK